MPIPSAFDPPSASPASHRAAGEKPGRDASGPGSDPFGKGAVNAMPPEEKKTVCGAKAVRKALLAGRAEKIYLARDASEAVVGPLRRLAEENAIPVDGSHSMRDLGKKASIEIGAAAVALTK